jgi:hypothetical protein
MTTLRNSQTARWFYVRGLHKISRLGLLSSESGEFDDRDVVEAAASYIASQLAEGCTHDEAVAKMWRMLNEEWDETRAADVKRRRASFHIVS